MGKAYRIVSDRFVIHAPFTVEGIWKARIRDRQTGRTTKVSSRQTKKQKADLFFQRWCEDRLKHEINPQTVPSRFDAAFEEWLRLKTLRPRTEEEYDFCFKGVYSPTFGELLVEEIDLPMMEQFLKDLETERQLKPRTRQKHLTYLRSFFRWARRRRYCLADPTEGLRVGRASKRVGIAMTLAEARKLVAASRKEAKIAVEYTNRKSSTQTVKPPEHLFLAVLSALHTGLRRGNITGMRWRHIDFAKEQIFFSAEEMKANADLEIPIHPELLGVLKERVKKLGRIDLNAPVIGDDIYSLKRSFKWALKPTFRIRGRAIF